jgi:WD40 repeat protein
VELLSEKERSWDACRTTLEGHCDSISAVVFSPNAQLIASASVDGTIRLWDTMTGLCHNVLEGHEGEVIAIAFSGDGQLIASGSEDGDVRLWMTTTGSCCNVFKTYGEAVMVVAFSPDDLLVASGSLDNDVLLWDTTTLGSCHKILEGHTGMVDIIVFSPDSQLVASASSDNTIRLWNTSTTEPNEHTLIGHTGSISAISFLSDEHLVVSASEDRTVRLWDAETGSCRRVLEGYRDSPCFLSSDGQLFMSALGDDGMGLWETTSGLCRGLLSEPLKADAQDAVCAVFSPDQRSVVLLSRQLKATLWDMATGSLRGRLPGGVHGVRHVCFSRDGQLVAGCYDHELRLWETNMFPSDSTLESHSDQITDVALSSNGQLIASASGDDTLRLWNVATGLCHHTLKHSETVSIFTFSPSGQMVASVSGDDTLRLWNVATGLCHHTLKHSETVSIFTFSPSGQMVASVSGDDTVKLWNVATGSCCYVLRGHCQRINSLIFSPDGQFIASISYKNTVRLWHISAEPCCIALEDDAASPIVSSPYYPDPSIVFSPDGQLIAISSYAGRTVRLYSTKTGCLEAHHDDSCFVAFSPDGQMVALAPHSNEVRLWMTTTQLHRSTLTSDQSIIPKGLKAIVFSPDGRFLISLALDGRSMQLWDVAKGGCCSTFWELGHQIKAIAFSPDGQLLQTDRGDVANPLLSDGDSSLQKKQTNTIFIDKEWLLYNEEPHLWLPPDYRTSRLAVFNDIVCLGLPSGRVVILRVAPGKTRLANVRPIKSRRRNKVVVLE